MMTGSVVQIRRNWQTRRHCLLLLWLAALAGCGEPTGIEGMVTYNGKPVTRGIISVTPADGRGKGEGGQIVDGAYRIAPVTTGRKKFSVRGELGNAEETGPVTSESKAQALAARESQAVLQIPPGAVGNGQFFEIVAGQQTFDIELSDPR